MNIGKIGSTIKPLINPLKEIGATDAATNLTHLCNLLGELKNETSEDFGKAVSQLELLPSEDSLLLGDIVKSLSATIGVATASGATAARINTLKEAYRCLGVERLSGVAFAEFAEALKASFQVDVIDLHLRALEAGLGTPRFDEAFKLLENDRRVKKPELAMIASRFISRTAKSAPKGETLKRIYSRHASLVDSANKQEWQKGKSAA
jgi:hypothetical protein